MPWWHFAFVATVVATGVFAVAELPASGRLVALLVLYAALIAVYAATPGKFASRTPRTVYLIGASSIFAAGCFLFPGASFLMFILIPQAFMMMGRRPAFVIVIGFALVSSGGELAYNGVSVATVATVGGSGVFTIVMSLLLGGYIGRIIEQSRQRASLIEELERTRSELAEVSRETGVLAERERLAREIHDALAQGFTSVIMLLQAATAALERGDVASAQHHLGLAEPAARDGLAEARSLISALAPLPLQGTSLVGAVERVCEELGSRLGFAVVFEVQGAAQALSHNAEIVLLRAAQVALVNVGRHSQAQSARVRLAFSERSTALEVVDDGVGFDPSKAAGFGLSQLRSRVSELGGTTVVDSACGNGTAVRVTVPNPGVPGELPAARLSLPFPQGPGPGAGVAPTHVEIA
jgi:signal transduction histidine kinase